MSAVISFLNETGERLIDFAWPMFWQSGVLIIALLLLDLILRRHVRAVVRYALLLLILVKLVIPPSIALPTSLAWWLVPVKQIREPQTPTVVITEVANTMPSFPLETSVASPVEEFKLPPPQLELGGWLMIGWCGIGIVLTGWLLLRARSIRRRIRRGSAGPVELAQLLNVEQTSGLSGIETGVAAAEGGASVALADRRSAPRVRVLLCDDDASPAVCGLIRPVILLPRRLLKTLSEEQLRAVLLHELAHIRRGDVWVNCAQIFLQVVYWWHPLVWLANAHIRRVREEAVDETVQVALGNEADVYPATLVEVARNIIARPRLSLGLVGIAEPGSALGRRIRRMLDRPVPRSSRLNVWSIIAIFACAALLLPMARGQQELAEDSWVLTMGEATDSADYGTNTHLRIILDEDSKVRVPPPAEALPMVKLTARFLKVSERDSRAIWESASNHSPRLAEQSWSALLSEAQVMNLESNSVFAVSNAIPVITLSGRQAQIQSIEIRTIMNGIKPEALAYPGVTSTNEDTAVAALDIESMRFGFVLDVIPVVDGGSNSVTMSLTVSATDFLGYAEKTPGDERLVYVNGIQQRVAAPSPLIREGLISLSTNVEDGVTLVLGNPIDVNGQPVESLGDGKNRLLVFITPTVVDAEGNRVHATTPTSSPPTRTIVPAPYPIRNVGEPGTNTPAASANPQGESSPKANSSFADSLPKSMYEQSRGQFRVEYRGKFYAAPTDQSVTNALSTGREVDRLIADGVFLRQEGMFGAASRKFKRVLELEPENSTAKEHLDEIEQIEKSLLEQRKLYTRVFKVDSKEFVRGLVVEGYLAPEAENDMTAISKAVREFFSAAVAELAPPKAIFFDDREGRLLVRATLEDLGNVESALQTLKATSPLVNVKVEVVEIGPPNSHNLNDWLRLDAQIRHAAPGVSDALYGILTDPQRRVTMRALEQRSATNTITETSVTTLSGRQAQVQVLGAKAEREEGKTGRRVVPPTGDSSTNGPSIDGNVVHDAVPTLDIIPSVSADGYTIEVTLHRTTFEFVGYDDPGQFTIIDQPNTQRPLPWNAEDPGEVSARGQSANPNPSVTHGTPQLPLPRLRVRQATTRANVYDGQTVVLFMEVPTNSAEFEEEERMLGALPLKDRQQPKHYLIFVTPTVIDSTGNRVHPPGSLPFKSDSIPPQR